MILQKNIFNINSAFSLSKKISSVSFSAGNITSNASENGCSNMVTCGKIKVSAPHYMLLFQKGMAPAFLKRKRHRKSS